MPPEAPASTSACRVLGAGQHFRLPEAGVRGHFRPLDAQVTGLSVGRADGHTGQVVPALKCPEGTLDAPVTSDRLCKSTLYYL